MLTYNSLGDYAYFIVVIKNNEACDKVCAIAWYHYYNYCCITIFLPATVISVLFYIIHTAVVKAAVERLEGVSCFISLN